MTRAIGEALFLHLSGVCYSCLGGPHAGVGRVGLGPPVGVFPLFKLEFSEKELFGEITMSTLERRPQLRLRANKLPSPNHTTLPKWGREIFSNTKQL